MAAKGGDNQRDGQRAEADPARGRERLALGSPAGVAAVAGAVLGLAITLHGITSAATGFLGIGYWIGVLLAGPSLTLLSVLTLRRQRVAWAFFVGMTSTGCVALAFASAPIRHGFDVPWIAAMAPALVLGALCVLASLDHEQFTTDRGA